MRKSYWFLWILILAATAGSFGRVHTQGQGPERAIPSMTLSVSVPDLQRIIGPFTLTSGVEKTWTACRYP